MGDRRLPTPESLADTDTFEFFRAGILHDMQWSDMVANLTVAGNGGGLPADGTGSMTGDLEMGGNNINAAGVTSVDSLYIGGVLASVTAFEGTNVAKTYPTVAAMVAASDLVVGDTAVTQGYASAGDGGAAAYRIVAAATGTADGGMYHDLTGITGQAELLYDSAINPKAFGAKGDGVTDDSAAFVNALAAGDYVYVPTPDVSYVVGEWQIGSNKTIWMESGVILQAASDANYIFRFFEASDSHVYANGALFDGDTLNPSTGGHNIYFNGCTRCTLRDARVKGQSRATKDGIYMGTQGLVENIDCGVIGGEVWDSGRNGISMIGGFRCYVDGTEIHDIDTAAPRAGIDMEANPSADYRNTKNKITNCHVYNCGGGGIQTTFGDRSVVEKNDVHDNFRGINMSGQSDNVGVESFDSATGWITIGESLVNVQVGMVVSFYATGAGNSTPSDMLSTGYIVQDHNGTDQIRVARALDYQIATSWAGDEVGTGNKDISLSDFGMNLFVIDNESNVGSGEYSIVRGNWIYDNEEDGVYSAICARTMVENNEIWDNGTSQIRMLSVYESKIKGNTIDIRDITPPATFGINITLSTFSEISGNTVSNTGYAGIRVATSSYSRVRNNKVYNCGDQGANDDSALYQFNSSIGLVVEGNVGRTSSPYGATINYGMRIDQYCASCVISGNIMIGAGPDNAGSISYASTNNNFYSNNVKYDGTLYVP